MKHDYTLSDEFRKNHFLAGLLLHQVKMSLSENRDIRKPAVTTLRNLLAKHAFDERYSSKVRFISCVVCNSNCIYTNFICQVMKILHCLTIQNIGFQTLIEPNFWISVATFISHPYCQGHNVTLNKVKSQSLSEPILC